MSLPTRAAWIEMTKLLKCALCIFSRCPHGQRGLKYQHKPFVYSKAGRCPHGQRGLKSEQRTTRRQLDLSLPTRAAWIEIINSDDNYTDEACRCPHGQRGLKSFRFICGNADVKHMSLPTRAAWIEIKIAGNNGTVTIGRCPHGQRGLK